MKTIKLNFNPDRAWYWLLAIFLILTTLVFVAGYFLYHRLDAIERVSQRRLEDQPDATVQLDRAALEDVRRQLETKAERLKQIRAAPSLLIDPSS